MKDFNQLPDSQAIREFLGKHNLADFESAEVILDTEKDVSLNLDFGDGETGHVNIRRRNGYNGNYRLVSSDF